MWNNNYFKVDTSYGHSGDTDNFWVYWAITSDIIPAKYLNYLPIDPKTNSNYVYGKTLDEKFFEIAWVLKRDDVFKTRIVWNYNWEIGPISLIREYNGPKFLSDKSTMSFPYNPNELLMTATIWSYSGSVSVNSATYINQTLISGDIIKVGAGWFAELYFSDWSISTLWDNTKESTLILTDMSYKQNNSIFTKIKLSLESGVIWTKATSLEQDWTNESQFDVYTADTSAAVRWTIFWVEKETGNTNIIVEIWKVNVYIWDKLIKEIKVEAWETATWSKIIAWGSISSITTPIESPVDNTTPLENIESLDLEYSSRTNVKVKNINLCKSNNCYIKVNWSLTWACDNNENRSLLSCNFSSTPIITKAELCKKIRNNKGIEKETCVKVNILTKEQIIQKQANENNLWKDWKVVFYDGFDVDFTPTNGSSTNTIITNLITKLTSWENPNFRATVSGFKISDWYLDASWDWNFLKYDLSNLNLWEYFAVEMRVLWLWTWQTKKYLFDWWNDLKVFNNNSDNLQIYSENNFTKESNSTGESNSTWSLNSINSNVLNTIIIQVENKKLKVKIDWKDITINHSEFINNPKINDLIIWANYSNEYNNQWGYNIEYIKIYKKGK